MLDCTSFRRARRSNFCTLKVFALCAALAPVAALGSAAPGDKVGHEFRINTSRANQRLSPALAMDARGGSVAVWQGTDSDGFNDIYGQRYDSSGAAIGAEFRVNTTATANQVGPAVAMAPGGDFIVVWSSTHADSYGDIVAQRYAADGSPQGAEFRVNTYTSREQQTPAVAVDAAGNFVIVWTSLYQDGYSGGIYGQRYRSDGAALGSEFQVNWTWHGNQMMPDVAMDASGDFIVVWVGGDSDLLGILGQRYAADGTRRGSEFQVNTYDHDQQWYPAVAMDADGDYVVAWASSYQDVAPPASGGWGVYGQRYAANGTRLGNEFAINTTKANHQYVPALAMDADGDFVVAWESAQQDGSGYGIYLQRYGADGSAQGGESRVNNTVSGDQKSAAIAMDADGDFLVGWAGPDGSNSGIYGQRFAGSESVDLLLTKTDGTDPVPTGDSLSYTLKASNGHAVVAPTGYAAIDSAIGSANTIRITDTLPSGLTFNSASGTDWTCSNAAGTVTCDYHGVLLPVTTSSVVVSVVAPNNGGSITNTGSLEAAQYDANPDNNSDSESTSVCTNSGTLNFSSDQYSVSAEGSTATIQVIRSGGTCRSVSVSYATSNGTAQSGNDYTAKSGILSWMNGESGGKSFTVATLQDSLDEDTETVTLALSSHTGGAGIGTPGAAVLQINDDDPAPTVSISTADGTVTEGASASVTLQLSAASGRTIMVPFTLGGTAASGDYTVTASPVTIPAGTTSMILATISSTDDALDEDVETVSISLGTPTNANAGSNSSYVLSINDNDAPPTVSISTGDASMTEASSTRSARVELSAPSAREISVGFNLSGSAALGSDYTSTASPITIPPGTTSATLSTISVQNDQLDEYDETIVVTLDSLVNVTAGADTDYTLTVTDDDPTPTVGFTAAAQTVNEGAGSATVTAQASAVSGRTIQIPFTRSGSATSPADYSMSASQIVIPAGSQSGSVTVTLMDDKNIELSEQAVFTMGTPINATAGATTSHTLTIKDNDPIALP